jgi:serine/threonine protein kinase
MGIANRDIKLDNILLHGAGARPVVKICDFGYSKDEVAGSICKTACGTPEYMAPEVRRHRGIWQRPLRACRMHDAVAFCGIMYIGSMLGTAPTASER